MTAYRTHSSRLKQASSTNGFKNIAMAKDISGSYRNT